MKLDSVVTGERRGAIYTGDASLRIAIKQCFEREASGAFSGLHFYFEGEDDVQCRVLRWNLRDCGLWTVQDSELDHAAVILTAEPVLNMDQDFLKPAIQLVQRTISYGSLMRWTASLRESDVDIDALMARIQQRGRAALVAGSVEGLMMIKDGMLKMQVLKGDKVEARRLLTALNGWAVQNMPHLIAKVEVYIPQ